jgi:GNAT superfamily N-acetyltransferase
MTTIETVSASCDLFPEVMKLWRSESATLGFMPRGGFEQAAASKCLIAAIDANRALAGYLLYRRTSRGHAAIVHLCVAPAFRGKGVARGLFDGLKMRCSDSFEVRLRCRRDFRASSLWPKLGFVPVADRAAKGRGALLTAWRYELAALPLLRVAAEKRDTRALRVVIDANVFFDLDERGPGNEESCGLLADWLTDFVELNLTDEILTEINRRESHDERDHQRARAEGFSRVPRDVAREEHVLATIRDLLPDDGRLSTASDARQLAMTVAAGVTFFVSRDGGILDVADEKFDLRAVSPHELILQFDELRREEEYRPKRLFLGPDVRAVRPRPEHLERMADLLHDGQPSIEPRWQTLGRLRELLAAPVSVDATCIEKGSDLIAAFFVDRSSAGILDVPYLAVSASALGHTAARHYGEHLSTLAANEGRQLVHIRAGGPRVDAALSEMGFSREGDTWLKIALPITGDAASVAVAVDRLGAENAVAGALARRVAGQLRKVAVEGCAIEGTDLAALERLLWPAKITATGLPCFIVPIQPRWAKDLFDKEFAHGTLFGAKENLVLNSENVYYRAAKPACITAPARLIWYASHDSAYPGSMALRACSYVDEVVIAPPKEVFRRFKRIGIYEWRDVFGLAKNAIENQIMAFRFAKTELMRTPVRWDALQSVLKRHTGKGSQIQSPLLVSEACFLELYGLGMGGAANAA